LFCITFALNKALGALLLPRSLKCGTILHNLKLKTINTECRKSRASFAVFRFTLDKLFIASKQFKIDSEWFLVGGSQNYNNAPVGFGLLMALANWQDKRLQLLGMEVMWLWL